MMRGLLPGARAYHRGYQAAATAEATIIATDIRRRVAAGADPAVAYDLLLNLADAHGLYSQPVAAYLVRLAKP